MYKVIKTFIDLKDNNYKYQVGDEYPRLGYLPSLTRINELSGKNNLQKTALIKEINDFDKINEELEEKEEVIEEIPKKKTRKSKQK